MVLTRTRRPASRRTIGMIYCFGRFELDTRLLELRRAGLPVRIVPRAFDLLRLLIEQRGRLVGKDELIETVWHGRVVSDATVGSCVNAARRAVGDDGRRQEIIRTVARRGFRFVANVTLVEEKDSRSAAANSRAQRDGSALAVLPFAALGDAPGLADYAQGLTRDVVTALWRWRSIPIVAPNSGTVRGAGLADIRSLGEVIGARYVLEGSVRRVTGLVRVTIELIDVATGHHVIAERLDAPSGEALDVQDEITQRIAAIVAPKIERLEYDEMRSGQPPQLDAAFLVRCGLAALDEYTHRENLRARVLFAEAIELDPHNSRAQSGMGLAYGRALMSGYEHSREAATEKALVAANRAVAYDSRDAFAYNALGIAYIWARQNADAIASFRTAICLNPSYGHPRASLGDIFVRVGRTDEGIALIKDALRLNPEAPNIKHFNTFLSRAHIASRRYEEALNWAKRAIYLRSDLAHAYCIMAVSLGHLGRTEEASTALDRCRREQPGFFDSAVELSPFLDETANQRLLGGLHRAGWKA